MRRRTLLLGVAAGLSGRHVTLGAAPATSTSSGTSAGTSAGRAGASAIMASTKTSSLAPQVVTPTVPVPARPPAAVSAIGRFDLALARDGRSLPTRVWHPAGPGPYPVIVFSHGLLSQPDDYAALLTGWARAGFVVAAPLYPHTSLGTSHYNLYDIVNQPADASAVLTQLLGADGPLRGRLDATRLVAAGHSAGGITTAGLLSDQRDERIKAAVLIAGTDFLGTPFTGPAAPALFMQGALDDTVAWSAAHTVFEAVPWSRSMVTFPDGGHVPTAAEYATIAATGTAFLRWALYGIGTDLAGAGALTDQRNASRTPATSAGSTS